MLRIIYQGKPKAQHTGAECNIPEVAHLILF